MDMIHPWQMQEVQTDMLALLSLCLQNHTGQASDAEVSAFAESIFSDYTIDELQWLSLTLAMQAASFLHQEFGEEANARLQAVVLERARLLSEPEE